MSIKAVVFDFDGVIVDSNRLKAEAFAKVFEGHPTIPQSLVAESFEPNLGTRFDVLRRIFERSGAPEDQRDALVQEYGEKYDALIQQGIRERGLAQGAREVLADFSKQYCLYINSATPQRALDLTVANLGIKDYFKEVLGADGSKEDNLRDILAREGIEGGEAVVIGDGENDLRSAQATGAHFIAVDSGFHVWDRSAGFPVIAGIGDVRAIALEKLV